MRVGQELGESWSGVGRELVGAFNVIYSPSH